MSKTTIDAMKAGRGALNAIYTSPRRNELQSHELSGILSTMEILDAAITREEAQTVEPKDVHSTYTLEREALIARLKSAHAMHAMVNAMNGSKRNVTLFGEAADMLSADAPKVQPLVRPRDLADNAEWLADKIMGNDYIDEAAALLRKMAPIVRAADACLSKTQESDTQTALSIKVAQQVAVPQTHLNVTEEMHQAAVKVLHRASGLDGLPQRMMDAMLAAAPQPDAPVEPMTRFCPGCGSVGEVPDTYRDCCPDGIGARVIPASLAAKCHNLFQLALSAAAPTPPQAERVQMTDAEIEPIVRLALSSHMQNYPASAKNTCVEVAYEVARSVLAARGAI